MLSSVLPLHKAGAEPEEKAMRSVRKTAAKALIVGICAVGTVGVGAATAYSAPARWNAPAHYSAPARWTAPVRTHF
jgi:hypothetical protein